MRVCGLHTTFELEVSDPSLDGGDAGVDIAESEVITDDHGKRYEKGFGKLLAEACEVDFDRGAKRGHAPRSAQGCTGQWRPGKGEADQRSTTTSDSRRWTAGGIGPELKRLAR